MVMSVGSRVKAVDQHLERIVKVLLILSTNRDAKTCSESRSLLHGICDFQFVLGLCVLRIKYKQPEYLPVLINIQEFVRVKLPPFK